VNNHRVICWCKGGKERKIVGGENEYGKESNQFKIVRKVYSLVKKNLREIKYKSKIKTMSSKEI